MANRDHDSLRRATTCTLRKHPQVCQRLPKTYEISSMTYQINIFQSRRELCANQQNSIKEFAQARMSVQAAENNFPTKPCIRARHKDPKSNFSPLPFIQNAHYAPLQRPHHHHHHLQPQQCHPHHPLPRPHSLQPQQATENGTRKQNGHPPTHPSLPLPPRPLHPYENTRQQPKNPQQQPHHRPPLPQQHLSDRNLVYTNLEHGAQEYRGRTKALFHLYARCLSDGDFLPYGSYTVGTDWGYRE